MLRTSRVRSLSCLLLCGLVVARASAAEDATAMVRQSFMNAMAAVQVAPTVPLPEDGPGLRRYALYPYLQAARLRAELRLVTPAAGGLEEALLPVDDRIAAFLEEQGPRPVTQKLREEW